MNYSIGTLRLQIHIEHSHSLKDKRQVLRSLKERLKKRHNVAVAEVAHHNSWQDAVVVAATVATTAHNSRRILEAVHDDAVLVLGRSLCDADFDVAIF